MTESATIDSTMLGALPITGTQDAPNRDQQQAASRGLYAGDTALHFSALRDIAVAADVAGEPNMREYNLSVADIYGAAMNVRGTHVSECGVFTDNNGNTLIVCDNDAQIARVSREKKIFGAAYYETSLRRYKGEGSGAANAVITLAGLATEVRGFKGKNYDNRMSTLRLPAGELKYYNVFDLFQQIESSGQRLDRPVVVVMTNDVITWSTFGDSLLSVVLAVAKPFAAMIGIPSQVFDLISTAALKIATTGRVDVADLATVAQTLAPESVRAYITQGAQVYSAVSTGDYVAAADALGISAVRQARDVIDKFARGLTTDVLQASTIPVQDTLKIIQNTFNIEATNAVRAQSRSGSLISKIIDAGSITRVPAMQDLLIASSAPTILGALPKVQELIASVVNETNDITNVHQHKAWIQAAAGLPIGDNVFDGLLVRSLVERAVDAARDGAHSFMMPITVPEEKRKRIAAEVAKQSGVRTLTPVTTYQDAPHYAVEWR